MEEQVVSEKTQIQKTVQKMDAGPGAKEHPRT